MDSILIRRIHCTLLIDDFFFNNHFLFYLKGKDTARNKHKSAGLLLQCIQQPGLGQAAAWSQESPTGVAELGLSAAFSQDTGSEAQLRLSPGSSVGCRSLRLQPHRCANSCSCHRPCSLALLQIHIQPEETEETSVLE